MLSGTRKYGVSLILAHQDMQQVAKRDSELAEAIATNAGARVCFRLGDTDAKRFANTLSTFDLGDLQNLGISEAIVRMEKNEQDFTVSVSPSSERNTNISVGIVEVIKEYSRKTYGTPKSTVEKLLHELYLDNETSHDIKKPNPEISESNEPVFIPKYNSEQIVSPPSVEVTKKERITQPDVSQHRYLQTLIKKMAESRGYRVSIEQQTPDKKGRVDVSLEGNGKRIACEFSVTSADIYEVHNIEKCLAAGYDTVVSCSTDPKILNRIKMAIEQNIPQKEIKKTLVATPEELFQYLDTQVVKETSREKFIKGYRVKVEYDPVSEGDMDKKKEAINKAIMKSKRNNNFKS
jgi:hypothetical protein